MRDNLLQWWNSVDAMWIVRRLGVVWRGSKEDPVNHVSTQSFLFEADSLSEDALKERHKMLVAEEGYNLAKASLVIIDPPLRPEQAQRLFDWWRLGLPPLVR